MISSREVCSNYGEAVQSNVFYVMPTAHRMEIESLERHSRRLRRPWTAPALARLFEMVLAFISSNSCVFSMGMTAWLANTLSVCFSVVDASLRGRPLCCRQWTHAEY